MFNEQTKEMGLPVVHLPQYKDARAKALDLIDSGKYGLTEADFWILMNKTKAGDKMCYSGLIIKHNACLKINDCLETKFQPSCVTVDKDGYGDSLVYSYCNDAQGIYEVGEVSKTNCKNAYPYAMAYKRLYDRVVLKLCKLAYSGIYSEVEAEEFKQPEDDFFKAPKAEKAPSVLVDKIKTELFNTPDDCVKCVDAGDLPSIRKALIKYAKENQDSLFDEQKNRIKRAVAIIDAG